MRVYNENLYKFNHAVAPMGNMANVDPDSVARLCDMMNIPWYTSAWPYASGLIAYCTDEQWRDIISKSKLKSPE